MYTDKIKKEIRVIRVYFGKRNESQFFLSVNSCAKNSREFLSRRHEGTKLSLEILFYLSRTAQSRPFTSIHSGNCRHIFSASLVQ